MAIDPVTEETFPLNHAPERLHFRKEGRPVCVQTVWRWALKGLRGIKLETLKIGGIRVTSEAALRRFFAAVNDAGSPPEPDHAAQHRQAVDQELDHLGIG
jgi:hypothetical protein